VKSKKYKICSANFEGGKHMRKEKGSITIIALTTVLFMIAFLVSTFTIIANRRQAQAEIKQNIKEVYAKDINNIDEIYESYFTGGNSVILISTVDELLKIGSGENVTINGRIYKFTADANYKLNASLDLNVADYKTGYPTSFKDTTWTEEEETTTDLPPNQVTDYETANSTSSPYSTYTAPGTGTYKLEVWGANGGSYNTTTTTDGKGGTGGYSVGTISLTKGEQLYVYVGGAGSYGTTTTYTETTAGGYNGGGNAAYRGGTGGGASDIRILGNGLYNRIIVAGGGGGGYYYKSSSAYKATGGNGGGTSGAEGGYYSSSYTAFKGGGATQTAGGTGGTGSSANYNGSDGTFGVGGDTGYKYNNNSYYSNGAGRRWMVRRRSCWKL